MSDLDAQSEEIRGARGNGDRIWRKQSADAGMYKRILEALIVASTIALIAAVWNLTQTATLLQASQNSLRRDLDRVERRQDSLEGKITRGGPDALDQQ